MPRSLLNGCAAAVSLFEQALRPEIIQNARPHKTKTVKAISSIVKTIMFNSELLS